MIEILLFGTFWFWSFIAVMFVIFVSLVEYEKGFATTVLALITIVALSVFSDVSPLLWVWQNPFHTIVGVAGWFLAGTAWMVVKWKFWLLRRRDEARSLHTEFNKSSGAAGGEPFEKWILRNYQYQARSYPPSAMEHKATIMLWMSYWPFSLVWTVLNDPVRRIWQWIYARLGGVLQKMSNSTFDMPK